MEEILKQLLEGQKTLVESYNKLADGQNRIIERLDNIEGRLGNVEGRLENVEGCLGNVEGRLGNVEGQVKENNGFIQALIHRTDELDAKFDGLLCTTATKDSITTLKNDLKADILTLNERLFRQESEMTSLKMVK
jgi:predicted nuclease with TOPRIM domain